MNKKWFGVVAVGLGIAVIVALFSPLASSHPDGLERVAEDKEFIEEAKDPSYEILPDYTIPGIENEEVSTILSGIVGIGIVAAVGFGVALLLKATSKAPASGSSTRTDTST
jgi:hypothetical protein